jgi:DNA (cytosine-5)-methyltransferase 1
MMRSIELFAGAGGLGMGLSLAGFEPVSVIEWDRWCCDTIRENRRQQVYPVGNWPNPVEGDVRSVNFTDFADNIELVSGGPPCQPFSLGGKHKAQDDNRDMWPQAVRAVRETRPKAFIFENVKGLTRSSFATYLAYIVHQLTYPEVVRNCDELWSDHLARLEQHHTSGSRSGLHYNVVWQVLNAADYGVPQRRERVVFVGFRSDLGVAWNFPRPTHSLDALLWDQFRSGEYWDRYKVSKSQQIGSQRALTRSIRLIDVGHAKPWKTVRDAICDLPDPDVAGSALVQNHRLQLGARSYPGHTGSPWDEPAKTLKAGVHGVPGGENMLLNADGSVRYFTVRESARLQTFPDQFELHGSWSEAMRQLGNAVPVRLAHKIAKHVADHLNPSGHQAFDDKVGLVFH